MVALGLLFLLDLYLQTGWLNLIVLTHWRAAVPGSRDCRAQVELDDHWLYCRWARVGCCGRVCSAHSIIVIRPAWRQSGLIWRRLAADRAFIGAGLQETHLVGSDSRQHPCSSWFRSPVYTHAGFRFYLICSGRPGGGLTDLGPRRLVCLGSSFQPAYCSGLPQVSTLRGECRLETNSLAQIGIMLVSFALGWGLITLFSRRVTSQALFGGQLFLALYWRSAAGACILAVILVTLSVLSAIRARSVWFCLAFISC
jgi:hypothetical protein